MTKLRNTKRTVQRQVHTSTTASLPKMSGAELARSSWAVLVESYAVVPDVYKSFFEPFPAQGQEFPYTVLTPSHERFLHKTSEKIICAFSTEIYVLERNGISFNALCYPFEGISYVEFRTALLASSIKICGQTSQGVHASSTLIFNSVTDYLFTPIMNMVRCANINSTNLTEISNPEQFEHLAKVNFKFMNYARHSLLGCEKVIHSVLQPEIRMSLLTVLGRTYYKTISPTHMSILTERELIMIREEAVRRKEDRYGGIWDYIPLHKIKSLSLSEKDNNLLAFSIKLVDDINFEFLYQNFAKGELNQFLEKFRELKRETRHVEFQ